MITTLVLQRLAIGQAVVIAALTGVTIYLGAQVKIRQLETQVVEARLDTANQSLQTLDEAAKAAKKLGDDALAKAKVARAEAESRAAAAARAAAKAAAGGTDSCTAAEEIIHAYRHPGL